MKLSYIKNVFLILGLILLITGGIYLSNLKSTNDIAENDSVVVFAFVNDRFLDSKNIANEWAQSNVAVEFISDCNTADENRNTACVTSYIKSGIKATQSLNAQFVLLGEGKYPARLLVALKQSSLSDNIAALVFLQADSLIAVSDDLKLPQTLVVTSAQDLKPTVIANRQLASNLRANGKSWFTMLVSNGSESLLSHPIIPKMVTYLIGIPQNAELQVEFDAETSWQQPIFDNSRFYSVDEAVIEHSVDDGLLNILKAFFSHEPYLLKQWPQKTYKAFDLIKYRSQLPQAQQGRYVTFSNRKGHKFYLDLDRYGRYLPEFVIGLDDENNLYRLTSFYKTKQFYSWEQGGPDKDMLYAEPLGAFIHFRKPVPRQYELPYLQYSSILFESIAFTDEDPYAELTNLTFSTFRVLTTNCIPCHKVVGVGGAAHHIDFRAGQPQGGFAHPLETYSEQVLKNFFFNQTATANLIGVNPNYVDQPVAEELLSWLQQRQLQ